MEEFRKVYVVAGEYWHPNSALYEGCVVEVCATRELAEKIARAAVPTMATKTQIYEHYLLEGDVW